MLLLLLLLLWLWHGGAVQHMSDVVHGLLREGPRKLWIGRERCVPGVGDDAK